MQVQQFGHGSFIKGYGWISSMYHTEDATVYICESDTGHGYKYFHRPL